MTDAPEQVRVLLGEFRSLPNALPLSDRSKQSESITVRNFQFWLDQSCDKTEALR